METRDRVIIQKIVKYCNRISMYLLENNNSFENFEKSHMFQDACCMCIVQIGELVGVLSDDFKSAYKSIPWRIIKDTRNFYVHAYGSIDLNAVWNTLINDIPNLKISCMKILEEL